MTNIDFKQIAPRCGGEHEAFEEICCQLAEHAFAKEPSSSYRRLRGDGGDGGVECFIDLPDGTRVGLQAKYVFDIEKLITQTTKSLSTAKNIHHTLRRYIICFPFNLTGPTRRKGKSGQEKIDEWKKKQEEIASNEGYQITIEFWPMSKLIQLLLKFDISGGIRQFFFNQKILTKEWFSEHLSLAKKTAGPRYTPDLNIKTDMWKWFSAFGRTSSWSGEFKMRLRPCKQAHNKLVSAIQRVGSALLPVWPEELQKGAQSLIADMETLLIESNDLITFNNSSRYQRCCEKLDILLNEFQSMEMQLTIGIEQVYGKGNVESANFRQFMAENMVSFPTINLDCIRDAVVALAGFRDWLRSPSCSLAYEPAFVLSGVAGSGKTHGVCDIASERFSEGLLTCIIFGHEFRHESDPWKQMLETMDLPVTLGRDGFLDLLNAAGEASGSVFILFVDAINETRTSRYWQDRLSAVSTAVQRRPYLRLCVTCRTPFLPYCLPSHHTLPIINHMGFSGIEYDACRAFFNHYGLEPPIAPILHPELSNPLYLRLLCQTLDSKKIRRMPSGWNSFIPVIRAFIDEKEKLFAKEYETSLHANLVGGSLMAIACAIADSGEPAILLSQAQAEISKKKPAASGFPVIEWLVRNNLLIEDIEQTNSPLGDEGFVRLSFERLGDFLISAELLKKNNKPLYRSLFEPGGVLYHLLKDYNALQQNIGVLTALSILVPEQNPGVELPNLISDKSIRKSVLKITIQSFSSRDPATFSATSLLLIQEALKLENFYSNSMDEILASSWQPSVIDAIWLDGLLKQKPLAERDAFWCNYLHERFELSHSAVHRLINAAFEIPLNQIALEIAERWTTVLLWFTAAADRRIKDSATRAATVVLTAHPKIIPNLVLRFFNSDDDQIRERTLLSCYGALILSRDASITGEVASTLQRLYREDKNKFENALIRDHIRCISELAKNLNVLPEDCDPMLTMQQRIESNWPLCLPSVEQFKHLNKIPMLAYSCLKGDFFIYSMSGLHIWEHAVSKTDMAKWILKRVAYDFGYENSECDEYDKFMQRQYGGGRSKPIWAERISKKYQWISMYQLASRLHDHVERKRASYEPELLQTPLILLEKRELDPTLSWKTLKGGSNSIAWWIPVSADLGLSKIPSDEEWLEKHEITPTLETLLATVEQEQQNWRMLFSYLSWEKRDEDSGQNAPYRQVWMHIKSYLVKKQDMPTAYQSLDRRNFFGEWMPNGIAWSCGFAGEYPWATPFNTEPEEYYKQGGYGFDLSPIYNPSWNQIAIGGEYDQSIPHHIQISVPARIFFSAMNLWWNGEDGYRLVNGKTIFRDPSVTEGGPASLLVDSDELLNYLERYDMCLIWTLLGEKRMIGHQSDKPTIRLFSQIARLNKDGKLQFGDMVFFDDFDKDKGPKTMKKKSSTK